MRCLPEHRQHEIVDPLNQRSLREVLEGNSKTRFLTLACGHLFTVEALDEQLELALFYDIADRGYRSARNPAPGWKRRPVCPTCQKPVVNKRYNRMIKRAAIDVMEQYAIIRMAALMQQVQLQAEAIDLGQIEVSLKRAVSGINFEAGTGKAIRLPNHHRLLNLLANPTDSAESIHSDVFDDKVGTLFYLPSNLVKIWRNTLRPVLDIYTRLDKIYSEKTSPHVQAFEAAKNAIIAHEEQVLAPHSIVTVAIAHEAKVVAEERIGVPFPQGEKRFKLEALLATITLRLAMAKMSARIAQALVNVPDVTAGPDDSRMRQVNTTRFRVLTCTILESCVRDARICHRLCYQAKARRLDLQTAIVALRADFELARYTAETQILSAPAPDLVRNSAADTLHNQRDEALERSALRIDQILDAVTTSGSIVHEWAEATIRPALEDVLEEWGVAVQEVKEGQSRMPTGTSGKLVLTIGSLGLGWGMLLQLHSALTG